MDFNFKIKLNGKALYETNLMKYRGIRINRKLNWKAHIDNIALKTPCPSAPVIFFDKFAEIASLVSSIASPANK